MTLLGPVKPAGLTPYAPLHLQRIAGMMRRDELMMSDIPWAVAWYGERPCVWLTPDDAETYNEMDKLGPVRAIFLTQRTSDRRFLSQMLVNQRDEHHDWGCFYLDSLPTNLPCRGTGQVPDGFPLHKALLDCAPDQMFISDRNRWQTTATRK